MILLILALGFILRVVNLNQSLWLDEAINVVNAKNLSLIKFIFSYPIGDFHPPGYFLILWLWTRIFGFSEIAVRSPSVIFGVISIFLIYAIVNRLINKQTSLISSLFLAFSPLHVYYSQEARMYSFATFAVCLSFYFFSRILNKSSINNYLGFFVANVLVFYSDYLAYLIFPAQIIYVLIFRKSLRSKIILIILLSSLSLLPWIPTFLKQLNSGINAATLNPAWANIVGSANIKSLLLLLTKSIIGRISVDNKLLYYSISLGLLILYSLILIFGLKKCKDSRVVLFLLWIIVPSILGFLISLILPIFAYFRFIFILPGICALLAIALFNLRKSLRIILGVVLILISLVSLVIYYINPKFQRENWRGAVEFVESQSTSEDLIIFEDMNIPDPFIYYTNQKKIPIMASLNKVPAENDRDLKNIASFKPKHIFFFNYLIDINDPKRLVSKLLKNSNYQLMETFNFEGVGFVDLYEKQSQ